MEHLTPVAVSVTIEQAQAVIDKYVTSSDTSILSLSAAKKTRLTELTPTKSYNICLSGGASYLLKVTPPLSQRNPSDYTPSSLSTERDLLQSLAEQQPDVPLPTIITLDTSQTILPFDFLLLTSPRGISLAQAKASGHLTLQQSLLLDLRVGSIMKEVHDHVQNDFFGLPTQEKDEMYAWSDAFGWHFECLLQMVEDTGEELPYTGIRQFLNRAIAFYLFDDCEVPSLVSLTCDGDSIIVDFDPSSPSQTDEVTITGIFPVSHAIWGDPLLEALFMNPSTAFLEGYGGSPIIFTRQKTKRLWYTLFLALVVMSQTKDTGEAEMTDKVNWARETLKKCIDDLKDAPCY